MSDLLDKGCVVWHRESVGTLLERMCFAICALCTFVYLQSYIERIESGQA